MSRDRSAAGAPDEREDDEDIALRVRYRDYWDTGERLTFEELIKAEFPLLWQMAQEYDFAERLGGCSSALHAEADAVLRELWMARSARAEAGT